MALGMFAATAAIVPRETLQINHSCVSILIVQIARGTEAKESWCHGRGSTLQDCEK